MGLLGLRGGLWLMALAAMSWLTGPAGAQGMCDPTVEQKTDTAYGYRQRGDRCEGLYATAVSATTLSVASFTRGRPSLDLTSQGEVMIAWRAVAEAPVRLRARSVKPDFYYQMDTVCTTGTSSYRWPTNLLRTLEVQARDLGVLGWHEQRIGGVQRRVLLPLMVSEGDNGPASQSLRMVVVPQVRLREVYLSLALIDKSGRLIDQAVQRRPLRYGHYPRGRGLPVVLPNLPQAGLYYGELEGERVDGMTTSVPFWFFHPGDG